MKEETKYCEECGEELTGEYHASDECLKKRREAIEEHHIKEAAAGIL